MNCSVFRLSWIFTLFTSDAGTTLNEHRVAYIYSNAEVDKGKQNTCTLDMCI